ncbi:MAG: hypothetical protein ABIV21_03630, partial [Pyrinomonadaceae bacterium]
MILIPGLSGSELRHKVTGERIWFKALRQKSEDLRLPISEDLSKNHDQLIPGDVMRTLKLGMIPITDVYGGLIDALETRGKYHEEQWDSPSAKGADGALYVFPYDWRLDNVENARRLVRQIEDLKRKLNKPDLKFDVVSHSMGGIIARYAAMYGDADMPMSDEPPVPTWAGAKHLGKIILMGTPNEGSARALDTLLQGFMLGGVRIDLPFFQDASKFTAFTMPAVFQLLPAPGTLKAFDDRLRPVQIDIYDPKVWIKYGWVVTDDKRFNDEFSPDEQRAAQKYFKAVLERAKRLHKALAATSKISGQVSFYVLGADCRMALDSIVIFRDMANTWKTLTRPESFVRADGTRVSEAQLEKVMLTPGDGAVTRRSLEPASLWSSAPGKYICEDHTKFPRNRLIQD